MNQEITRKMLLPMAEEIFAKALWKHFALEFMDVGDEQIKTRLRFFKDKSWTKLTAEGEEGYIASEPLGMDLSQMKTYEAAYDALWSLAEKHVEEVIGHLTIK